VVDIKTKKMVREIWVPSGEPEKLFRKECKKEGQKP
jgi:hypothetical protein